MPSELQNLKASVPENSSEVSLYMPTPVGPLRITASCEGIREVHFLSQSESEDLDDDVNFDQLNQAAVAVCHDGRAVGLAQECFEQLSAYFTGSLKTFDLPLAQQGTVFQEKVWNELLNIGYGHTASYLTMAKRLGDTKLIRAAASANGKNHIAIIVPCHRVIGSSGELIGYAGGLQRKRWLLEHEQRFEGGLQTLF